ncbi:amidase signature domain-containing protein [Colletotrichum phormii]|uniref:Amidase signature domain-containing protein n=1 Tax=Colletotrichum phormii TaxID=359342 RepID=A0AAJ0EG54_9PEZI|nr:amidase signature domain-containing protein [Colletotrichum phormii]KAK1635711.1 amidase signature domain-containing protein [Colletotrichum phormii]
MADWEQIAREHRKEQKEKIPSAWLLDNDKLDQLRGAGTTEEGRLIGLQAAKNSGILDSREIDITENYTARELVRYLRLGALSAEKVATAYCKRAAVAQQLTFYLTEIFFEDGIERARWLDQQLRETGKVLVPLHGLPISLKDSFHVDGHSATVGYVEFVKQAPPKGNAALVKLLLDAGAVLYCKTNIPQTMMTCDSENNIFGRTLNPHNTKLTAGGSSGGEGALVAFRGSPLGIGSDLAGSARIPAFCCGLYGFKVTVDRVPFSGQSLSPWPINWMSTVMLALGPLATSADDLSLFMEEVVTRLNPWKHDGTAINLSWRSLDEPRSKPLTIGILPEDPEYTLHPPVRRSLAEAASALEKAGHKVVHLAPEAKRNAALGARISYQYFSISAPAVADFGEPFVASAAKGMHPFSTGDFPQQHDLDIVLAPGALCTAVPHDTFGLPVYTVMWSLIDYPAAVIPFGTASATRDSEPQKAIAEFVPDYIPEATDGAPCAVQVIAPRFRDEECLEAVGIIDKILNARHQ